MRLLRFDDDGGLSLTDDLSHDLPPYAILSHTWESDVDEVTMYDLEDGSGKFKAGYRKIQFCGHQAQKDNLQHFWVDTCCIDRANLVELSEAITSMFLWYQNSVKCYAYLSDVSSLGTNEDGQTQGKWKSELRHSRWFTRGWTLQELLAPRIVEFFSREEKFLGDKKTLEQQLHDITSIPIGALRGDPLSGFSVDERMRWTSNRVTKKIEDRAYCLLGIFDVSMSLRYGEREKAFTRLESKVSGSSKYREMIMWLAPARPEALQTRIFAARHPESGESFMRDHLLSWLHDKIVHKSMMWITGKSGSGKSTLFSLAVEKIKDFAHSKPATLFAYHYCTFSDPQSQQLVNILGSLAVHISGWKPAILEDLKERFDGDRANRQRRSLQISELKQVLMKHIATFRNAIILIDALDESENFVETSQCLAELLQQLSNTKIMVTSTRRSNTAGTDLWPYLEEVEIQPDEDIQAFVNAKLSDHEVLGRLSSDCKETVRSVLTANADQSFRWVCLTMDNLCRQRTGKAVKSALKQLPKSLNDTYGKMLQRISAPDRNLAREVFLWLSFAMRTLTLRELSEAAVLEDSDITLDEDSRLYKPEVILEICHGFLEYDFDTDKVKFAHSSVRNYLLSDGVKNDSNSYFHLDVGESNRLLMRKCLMYLMFDDFKSGAVTNINSMPLRQQTWPLLNYSSHNWGSHASFATNEEWDLAEKFFSTRSLPRHGNYGAWVSCLSYNVMVDFSAFICDPHDLLNTQPLYFAASFGLTPIVQSILSKSVSVDLEYPGGRFGSTPLQVASFRGRKEIAEILVKAGADFWSKDAGSGLPAWYLAHHNDWTALIDYMIQLKPEIAKMIRFVEEEKRRQKARQTQETASWQLIVEMYHRSCEQYI